MKKILIIAALVILCGSLAACSGTSSSSSSPSSPAPSAPAPSASPEPTLDDLFTQKYQTTKTMCTLYFSLVNQGWTDPEIYTQLEDGGGFDGYPGDSGQVMFHALIKWCYAN